MSLVATDGDKVIDWAAASPVSNRCAYAGVVENSDYVDSDYQGRGVGRLLLGALIVASEAAGNWTIQTGIFPENTANLAFHESLASVSSGVGSGAHVQNGHGAGVPIDGPGRCGAIDDRAEDAVHTDTVP